MWTGLDHGSLNDPHQATVNLANLGTTQQAIVRTAFQQTSSRTENVTSQRGYHSIAAVTGQDDDVNGRRVVGDTDPAILGFILTAKYQTNLLLKMHPKGPDC